MIKLFEKIRHYFSRESCYTEMEKCGYATMGCCCGRAGGTWATDYLSKACLDCKHLVLDTKPLDGGEKNDN